MIMTDGIVIEASDVCVEADDRVIDDGLGAFNDAAADLGAVKPLRCYARTADGELVGGILARRWGACCEVQIVWVRDEHRRKGIASKLMRKVEEAARGHGCNLVYLETFSFQAPQLYKSLGYDIACAFEGFPDGVVKYIMRKTVK